MLKRNPTLALSALLILLLAGLAWASEDDPAPMPKECEQVKECHIEWKDLPEAVQETIKEHLKKITAQPGDVKRLSKSSKNWMSQRDEPAG